MVARARHQRTTPLLRLLGRLGWQRDRTCGPCAADITDRLAQRDTSDPEADDHHHRDTGVAA